MEINMNNSEAVKKLLGLLKGYSKTIAVIIGCLLISTGLSLCIPLLNRQIMDEGFIGENKSLLIELTLILMAIYGINSIIDIIKEKKRVEISAKLQYFLSEQSFAHLMKMKMSYFNSTNYAELLNNINTDIGKMVMISDESIFFVVTQTFNMIGGLIGLFIIDYRMSILVIIFIPIKCIVMKYFAKKQKSMMEDFIRRNQEYAKWFGDTVEGIKEVKLFNIFDKKHNEFLIRQKGIIDKQKQMNMLSQWNIITDSIMVQLLSTVLYIVGGGRNSDRLNIPGTLMIYNGNEWFNLDENEVNKEVNKQFPENNFIFTTKDYTGIAVDPKDPTHYFVSAYGEGVLEFRENKFVKLYNHTNSTISPALNKTTEQQFTYNRIGSLTFDKEGNLWMTNCEIDDGSIKVLKADGTWISLIHDKLNHAYQADKILIASNNRKWINSPSPIGIFVLDDKGTIDDVSDDEFDSFTIFKNNNESIEAAGFYCVTEDKNGQIWIGTNRGPVYCLNSKAEISKLQFSRVIRPLEDGNGEGYAFLDGEQVNAIAVDGGNRKWIGTQSSGVFLVSEDGMETISNFTTANSPLPSNQVNTLAINQQTGEVFIGTEKGLVSYMGDATEGSEDYSDIYAYPNPVRPEQNDRVTIVGLMNDSNVKITDLKGNIIYQGKSAGGTFTWDCRRKGGGRVATGIYLVLSATPEAKESVVTKIMVVK